MADDLIESADDDDEEEDEEDDGNEKAKMSGLLRSLMLNCLSAKTPVALLHGLERQGNRMMAFCSGTENFHYKIHANVERVLSAALEEDEDEEEEDESFMKEFEAFSKKAKDKKLLREGSELRAFLAVRFAKQTIPKLAGQNKQTVELMQLVVKVLVLEEVMLQQIPLQHRCFETIEASDWKFMETVSNGLERFLGILGTDLGNFMKAGSLDKFDVVVSDLFDGRLYRHLFHIVVEQGLSENKKEVLEKFFGFQKWIIEIIKFMWSESGAKDGFFPIKMGGLVDLDGISPPEMPDPRKPLSKPQIQKNSSDLLQYLMADEQFATLQIVDAEDAQDGQELWETHNWGRGAAVSTVDMEQKMEDNKAEAEFKRRQAQKKKITAYDIEFQRKFALKRRQQALRALHTYSKSLTGSDKMHPPIIMAEKKEEVKKEEKKEEKISKKHQELLHQRHLEATAKLKENDASQYKSWEKQIDSFADIIDPAKMEKELLDLLLGFQRVVDTFAGFPAVCNSFKTHEMQAKVLLKIIKNVKAGLKKMQPSKLPDQQAQVKSLVIYCFCLAEETYKAYKSEVDGKNIKLLQEFLQCIGFPSTAKRIFEAWKEYQIKDFESKFAFEPPERDGKDAKGGKDDKKGKKDDKKDAKKDDKKDKKDKKDDKKDKKDSKKDDKDDKKAPTSKEEVESDCQQYLSKKQDEVYWAPSGEDAEDEAGFQLKYMGPYMERTTGTAKDDHDPPRVHFRPDKWQKDLLDIVDANESALVLAPTASGKTFICYYVMDKVLRADNDGVAVYVAPSKALVNQVSAEVYARFSSKTYPAHSKNELLGVFLREYNSAGGVFEEGKWKQCQVLVTIPHILELILLSNCHQDWVKRLRWVVFDEVHCIGQQESGTQWEHTMQMIPCPFLALSATVANPASFHQWNADVAKLKGTPKVHFVQHKERWNDLYKHVFLKKELRPVHPFCCLLEEAVREDGFASDFTMTPSEVYELYNACVRILGKQTKVFEELKPAKFFSNVTAGYLTKKVVIQWEGQMKCDIEKLMKEGTITSELFHEILSALGRRELEEVDDKEDGVTSKGPSYMQPAVIFDLCKKLDKSQNLPAIIFNFHRTEINQMLKGLCEEMLNLQRHKYYGTEEAEYRTKEIMKRRWADYERKHKQWEAAQKQGKSQKSAGGGEEISGEGKEGRSGKQEVEEFDDDKEDEPIPPTDIAEDIDPEFTFHSPKALGQWQEDIEEMFKELHFQKTPKYLVDALRRGIGMHHEGCKTKYREKVEVLFRRGFLRVVFATGTLGLGINMPCRSTVFCGDSLELTSLMFRQMSGRAGRRGFDLQGQVIFMDLPFAKMQRLVSSELPILAGLFKLSATNILRCLQEWHNLDEQMALLEQEGGKTQVARSKKDIATCLGATFKLPFFSREHADLQSEMVYFTRFSIEFLMKEQLLSESGMPRGLSGMVTHLFDIEPANFLLNRILLSGGLHDYLTKESKSVKKDVRSSHLTVKLAGILSFLMYRQRVPRIAPQKTIRKKHLPSAECPYLKPLPDKLLATVQAYNSEVFSLFQHFAWATASKRKLQGEDYELPYTRKAFVDAWDPRGEPFDKEPPFKDKYIGQIVRFRARSPLAAVAGVGDHFGHPFDLVNTVRPCLHLDPCSLPMLLPARPVTSMKEATIEPTSSYIVDFLLHGKLKNLWNDNRINATEAYKKVSGFNMTLKMMVGAMEKFVTTQDADKDIVLVTLKALMDEIKERLSSA
eukprot:gnl/MRDRNA2_/MRDRNA2_60514_c0_seq1.p1 gnl/MRDRNA2_/MRDRNA2_60514_c0~~gnl/MRDRNA2_/MRDRNA2_60514_c0_seq1.p1  ORF type:complete len:1869 (+),score=477.09 gnl/MRDRNA2_/MRDRNA2_60514_c0_seq1:406-5607(+)